MGNDAGPHGNIMSSIYFVKGVHMITLEKYTLTSRFMFCLQEKDAARENKTKGQPRRGHPYD